MAAAERAAEELRELILAGKYAPGERLGEVELAASLGMSRTPVRDALHRLAAEGLVELTSQKGARVTAWSQHELEHVFALRGHLEGFAAAEAAKRATPEQIDHLEDLARAIERHAALGPEDYLAHVYELNSDFHSALLAVAGSSTLRNALSGLIHAPVLVRTLHAFDEQAMWRSVNHHLEIVAALRAHDAEWAESVMRSHLRSARASLIGLSSSPDVPTRGE
jgi:DNA-binding GntR family transcriptional regulator